MERDKARKIFRKNRERMSLERVLTLSKYISIFFLTVLVSVILFICFLMMGLEELAVPVYIIVMFAFIVTMQFYLMDKVKKNN